MLGRMRCYKKALENIMELWAKSSFILADPREGTVADGMRLVRKKIG